MNTSLGSIALVLASFVSIPSIPAAAAAPAGDAAQDPLPDARPEVKALIETFSGHVDKRGKEDVEAVGVIDKFLQEFPKSGPKDREAIVKALDRCFLAKRQEDDTGVRENRLFIAAAVALGEMAPESVKVLSAWIGHKSHRRDVTLQRQLIQRLGKTKAEEGRKLLIKLLDDEDAQIQAAVAESLGQFAGADLKLRKTTFEELLKLLMTVKGQVDSDPNDTIARERYDMIAAPIVTSLQGLSKHQETDPVQWLRWWNKNKKDDWDNLGS